MRRFYLFVRMWVFILRYWLGLYGPFLWRRFRWRCHRARVLFLSLVYPRY